MAVDQPRAPFGSRRTERAEREESAPTPVPVLHVGEVHAELRLHVTDDTLTALGSQIASMIANAVAQGFQTGMEVGMARVEGEDGPQDGFEVGTAIVPPAPALTEEDLRRARGD